MTLRVSDGSGALFLIPFFYGIKKKRERTARPDLFREGHAQRIIVLFIELKN
jgi:hypothetical protein